MFYLYKPTNIERNSDDIISVGLELSWIILSDLWAVYTGFSVAKATAKVAAVKWKDKGTPKHHVHAHSYCMSYPQTYIWVEYAKICVNMFVEYALPN